VLAGFVGSAIFLFLGRPKTTVADARPPVAMTSALATSPRVPPEDSAPNEAPSPVVFEMDRTQDAIPTPDWSMAAASMQAPSLPLPIPGTTSRAARPSLKPAASAPISTSALVPASPLAPAAMATSKFAPEKIKEMLDHRE
jgi:hypothetical protein